MALIWQDKVPSHYREDFINEVIRYSNQLGIDPNCLMAVMYFESAGSFSPSIQNPYTNATGLIQFMPSTAYNLGTSVESLKQMTAVEQLYYVYKYYQPYQSKIKGYVDLYLVTFFPAAVGKALSYVLQTSRLSAEMIASVNPVFDLDNNNAITVGEITTVMLNKIPYVWKGYFEKKKFKK